MGWKKSKVDVLIDGPVATRIIAVQTRRILGYQGFESLTLSSGQPLNEDPNG